MDQSSFKFKSIVPYLSERFQVWRFGPLAFILYLGYLLCVDFNPVKPSYLIVLVLLILSFRLLDDLFDLQFDRVDYPERTLSKTKDPRPFIIFLAVLYLLLAAFLILEKTYVSLSILLATMLFLCAWYIKFRYFFNSRMVHSLVILIKYPLFLYILAPGLARIEIPVLLYLTFLLFEIQDDPELRLNAAAGGIQTISLLVYLSLLFLLLSLPSKSVASWLVLFVSFILQLSVLTKKNGSTACYTFFNIFLLFGFLSARYFLE